MTITGSPSGALTDMLLINTCHPALTHLDALAGSPSRARSIPDTTWAPS